MNMAHFGVREGRAEGGATSAMGQGEKLSQAGAHLIFEEMAALTSILNA